MICCTLGTVAFAAVAAHRRQAAAALRLAPAVALPVVLLAAAAFAAWHLEHYAARAAANDRGLWAEFVAAPLCAGAPPAEANAGSRRG